MLNHWKWSGDQARERPSYNLHNETQNLGSNSASCTDEVFNTALGAACRAAEHVGSKSGIQSLLRRFQDFCRGFGSCGCRPGGRPDVMHRLVIVPNQQTLRGVPTNERAFSHNFVPPLRNPTYPSYRTSYVICWPRRLPHLRYTRPSAGVTAS